MSTPRDMHMYLLYLAKITAFGIEPVPWPLTGTKNILLTNIKSNDWWNQDFNNNNVKWNLMKSYTIPRTENNGI